MYDFRRDILKPIQTVRSHEVQILQLCDILLGAVSYATRELATRSLLEIDFGATVSVRQLFTPNRSLTCSSGARRRAAHEHA
jgi:hypothetical protein